MTSSIRDFDFRALLPGHFFRPSDDVARQLQKRFSARTLDHRLSGVAPDPYLRIERQLAQEVHLHLFRRALPAAVAENVDALAAMRAAQVAHVLDQPEDRHL